MVQVAASSSPETHEDVQLLKDEEGGLMMEDGIATITFFKGDENSRASATKELRTQFHKVVASNPWLAGRLVRTKGEDNKSHVHLRHSKNPTVEEIDFLFRDDSDSDSDNARAYKLSKNNDKDSSYAKICTDMYKSSSNKEARVIVGSGHATVDKENEPVTLLTLSSTCDNDGFALVFSLSHVVGDGRTYYEIFRMLKPGAAVKSQDCARIMTFSEDMREDCGRKELKWADSPSVVCMYTCSMMFGGKKAQCFAMKLDAARIKAAKENKAQDVDYVTTNDVLTSGFFNECGSRIGMMGMDCRGRTKGIAKDGLAGNYVTALTLDPDTFATPSTIRHMMTSAPPFVTTKQPLPTCTKWLCGKDSASFAMVTNWSSFVGNGMVELEGCAFGVHLPIQNPAHCVYDLMIPFAYGTNPHEVGVLCWTVSSDEEGLREALPVGESLSPVLFPSSS